jgi:hypothetical protein
MQRGTARLQLTYLLDTWQVGGGIEGIVEGLLNPECIGETLSETKQPECEVYIRLRDTPLWDTAWHLYHPRLCKLEKEQPSKKRSNRSSGNRGGNEEPGDG